MPAVAQDELRRPPRGTVAAARVIGARKVYGRGPAAVTALDGVTAGFPAGRFTAVMGPSGSGMLLHVQASMFFMRV